MNKSKWLAVAGFVLVANTAIVTVASVWRIAVADDAPVAVINQETSTAPATDKQPSPPAVQDDETNLLVELPSSVPGLNTEANRTAKEATTTAEVTKANVLDSMEAPYELPEVPSLDHQEQFDKDPLMQELRSLFENRSDGPQLETLGPPQKSAHSAEYFNSIDNRLKTVRLLTLAAQSITTEAEELSQKKLSREKVDELLTMSAQLRSIAAKLLVSEP